MRNTHTILFLAATLLVSACVAKANRPGGPAKPGEPAKSAEPMNFSRRILVHDRALDLSTGELVADFDSPRYWPTAMPVPDRPGWYTLEAGSGRKQEWQPGRLLNPTTGEFVVGAVPERLFDWNQKTREHVRLNDDGTEKWRFAEPGQPWGMAPHATLRNYRAETGAHEDGTDYMGFGDALVAIEDVTGKELWRVSLPCGQLVLTPDFLLAVFWIKETDYTRSEVRAIAKATGEVVFTVPLWQHDYNGVTLLPCGNNFLARSNCYYKESGSTKLFDNRGRVLLEVREVLEPLLERRNGGWLASGSETVSSWDGGGKLDWAAKYETGHVRRDLLELPDGDIIVAEYCPIAATDVEVSRLDEESGECRWATTCASYGVFMHSAYSHGVYLELIDGKLVVCSQQSMCVFGEVLDLGSGKQVRRWELTEKLGYGEKWWE